MIKNKRIHELVNVCQRLASAADEFALWLENIPATSNDRVYKRTIYTKYPDVVAILELTKQIESDMFSGPDSFNYLASRRKLKK